jgi:hypothetical protein
MTRYLDSKGLSGRRAELFPSGEAVDLMAADTQVFAWTDKQSTQRSTRERNVFHVQSDGLRFLGVALVSSRPRGVNLSGGRMRLRYRSAAPLEPVTIALKPVETPAEGSGLIPKEIFTRLAATGDSEAEIEIPLPAMPGLTQVKEVVLTYEPAGRAAAIDLALTHAEVIPIGPGERTR